MIKKENGQWTLYSPDGRDTYYSGNLKGAINEDYLRRSGKYPTQPLAGTRVGDPDDSEEIDEIMKAKRAGVFIGNPQDNTEKTGNDDGKKLFPRDPELAMPPRKVIGSY